MSHFDVLHDLSVSRTVGLANSSIVPFPTPETQDMSKWFGNVYEMLQKEAQKGEFSASIIFVNRSAPYAPQVGHVRDGNVIETGLAPSGFFKWYWNMYSTTNQINANARKYAMSRLNGVVLESIKSFVDFWNEHSDVESTCVNTGTTIQITFDWEEPNQKRPKN